MKQFLSAILVLSPLLGGMLLHGLCIRYGWLQRLAIPLDAGAVFRGRRVFGDNKTYRGFVAVGIGTGLANLLVPFAASADLLPYPDWMLRPGWRNFAFGAFLGVCAMAFELPNSFVKRQLDISPGTQAAGVAGALFHVLDQVDILAGVWLAMAFVIPLDIRTIAWSAVILFFAHQVLTVLGFALGMRRTPR